MLGYNIAWFEAVPLIDYICVISCFIRRGAIFGPVQLMHVPVAPQNQGRVCKARDEETKILLLVFVRKSYTD